MRLLFTSLAAYGHVYPLLPLAVAARAAGHEVLFATAEGFLPQLRDAGVEPVAAGLDVRVAFDRLFAEAGETPGAEMPLERMTEVMGRVFGDVLPRSYFADLTALFERRRPDLVVYEASNLGGSFAARAAGIPAVGHTFGHVMRVEADEEQVAPLARLAAEFGLDWLGLAELGHPFVDICPDSVQHPGFRELVPRLPVRPVGWSADGELPDLPDGDRPLVYLTLGTVMGSADVLRTVIDGLAVLDVDVLVASGPTIAPAALGELPPNVRSVAWVPQARLLRHVDFVVHHGGNGTMLGAFAAGLPQLVLPQGGDQFANSEAVAESGAGARLTPDEVTAEVITDRVAGLLKDSSVHDAARAVAAEIAAMPSPAEAVPALLAHA
ncbi:glycosyltransferase [Amycolatopsis nalaikhensis]|uniref:Glycosyltransferase n=1 Tax=Amycolatopsis nalaikhensis TaxID=715472 RepID=A0ABY8XRB9_9PSEU|nr:glycosyltransferase [Amycolatopsis sp. 2-2]WIV58062.1 glycosyltransferase [Amycolatopsis sp. 2-2]